MTEKIYVIRMFTPDPYHMKRYPNNGMKNYDICFLKEDAIDLMAYYLDHYTDYEYYDKDLWEGLTKESKQRIFYTEDGWYNTNTGEFETSGELGSVEWDIWRIEVDVFVKEEFEGLDADEAEEWISDSTDKWFQHKIIKNVVEVMEKEGWLTENKEEE